jgi:hypothetical protein
MPDTEFSGLIPLTPSAFPKKCNNCGRIYQSAEEFFNETLDMPKGKTLRSDIEEDGNTIVEAFRNCKCGSTLMDVYNCRRDQSTDGKLRRENFVKSPTNKTD